MLLSSTSLLIFINLKSFNNNKRRSAPRRATQKNGASYPTPKEKPSRQNAYRIPERAVAEKRGKADTQKICTTYLEAIVKRGQKSDASS